MDLSAFKEAHDAVQRITKDYKPVADLAAALEAVRQVLAEVGELENARVRAKAELAKVEEEKAQAQAALGRVKAETNQAQAILDRVKAALSGIKL
jgi:chromosome segregation ATPase